MTEGRREGGALLKKEDEEFFFPRFLFPVFPPL